MAADERTWRIGEVATATGLTVRALHHYDQIGLVDADDPGFAEIIRLTGDAMDDRLRIHRRTRFPPPQQSGQRVAPAQAGEAREIGVIRQHVGVVLECECG
ncbi:MAG: MerR family DNA-binding transcriptional regulator [Streptosporangiaceae bacterium]